MFCQNCGNKLLEQAKFCNNCGYKVETVDTNQVFTLPQQSNMQPTPKAQNSNKTLKITFFSILGASVLFMIIAVAIMLTNMGSHCDIRPILLDADPQVDVSEFSDWGDREFSISNITTEETVNKNLSYELESEIVGAWEKINMNDYYGVEFYGDGLLRYVKLYAGEDIYDVTIEYEFISENQIMLGNNPENVMNIEIDYDKQFKEYYLIFGLSDDYMELGKVETLNPMTMSETVG